MTKEEIENDAAEYLKTLTPDGWDDFENQPTYNAVQLVKAIYHGYEQGYEDCRHYAHDYYKPKWHDLRKDLNDLPKAEGAYYCKIDPSYYGEMLYQGYKWLDMVNADDPNVIAWCELPKFEE